jgi:hypothetical protein
MATDEPSTPHDNDAAKRRDHRVGVAERSHLVDDRCKWGWETRRCQTTAHSPSVCGVTRCGWRGGIIMTSSATRAV